MLNIDRDYFLKDKNWPRCLQDNEWLAKMRNDFGLNDVCYENQVNWLIHNNILGKDLEFGKGRRYDDAEFEVESELDNIKDYDRKYASDYKKFIKNITLEMKYIFERAANDKISDEEFVKRLRMYENTAEFTKRLAEAAKRARCYGDTIIRESKFNRFFRKILLECLK